MAITYNGTSVAVLSYNTTPISQATYNTTPVYASGNILIESYSLATDSSMVPPPYDENGYNYNATAPEKTAFASLDLGDITAYTQITFEWDNEGSSNSYGDISCWAIIHGQRVDVYSNTFSGTRRFTATIDVSSLSGNQTMDIHLSAKSRSSYRGYISRATINMYNISASSGAIPDPGTTLADFTVDSGVSVVAPPYDANGYNYNATPSAQSNTYTLTIDTTDKNSLTFNWNNTGSTNSYGTNYGKYTDIDSNDVILFEDSISGSGSVTIDISSYTGSQSIVFTAYAKSNSSYSGNQSRAVLNIKNIVLS